MPAINVAKLKRAVRIANAINSIEVVPVSENAQKPILFGLMVKSQVNKLNHRFTQITIKAQSNNSPQTHQGQALFNFLYSLFKRVKY